MARLSRSLLDPLLLPLVPRLYAVLALPRRLWPEAIVLGGHALAIGGAVAFAFAGAQWWAGLLAAAGVAGNHLCDMIDGTHARSTGQCRNGGELLDHFTDPLSFSYWMIGLGVCAGVLQWALAAVLIIYATAVLTNIRAKLTGEFILARFGPTEFKALLVLLGVALAGSSAGALPMEASALALWWLRVMVPIGVLTLIVGLIRAVRDVNARGAAPDTRPWSLDR